MSEIMSDAAGANESPAAVVVAQPVRKPAKRSAAPKAEKVSAEAVVVAPAKPAKPAKPVKSAKPSKTAAATQAVKAPKISRAAAAEPVKRAKAVKVAKPVKTVKPAKPVQPAALPEVAPSQPKLKLVRDSFTIPELEYAQLEALKRRALGLAHHAKKSEVLRAGIATMAAMNDAQLLAALQSVPSLKTGRPRKVKADKAVAKTVVKARNGAKNA